MIPLYDKDCNLIAWLKMNEHIFSTNMDWIAFIKNRQAWSAETGNWLGPINGSICLDQTGRVVAWSPGEKIQGSLRPITPIRAIRAIKPIRPIRPITPIKPIRPIAPLGGWSLQSFFEWVNQ
jgi:hypothetical protein